MPTSNSYEVFPVPTIDLHALWPKVKPGIEIAIKRSANEATMEQVEFSLFNGAWDLWMVANGTGPRGFAVTEIMRTGSGSWVNIPFAFSYDGLEGLSEGGQGVIEAFFSTIERRAKENGMKGVKFVSCRPGWGRIAGRLGYDRRFVEYVKET